MSHKQLTLEQRYHISALWEVGHTQSEIAEKIGVHKSTISRELKRNMFWRNSHTPYYKPHYAQTYCTERHKYKKKRISFTKEIQKFVKEKLLLDWSPEQISGYAKKYQLFSISHERIYQFILKNKEMGGELYKHLRHQNKRYRKRYGSSIRTGPIKNRQFIDERPAIVDEKKRIGDWEIDTIIGKDRKQAIVTIVERVSKKVGLKKVESKTAELVSDSAIHILNPYRDLTFTITGDNVLTLESRNF